MVAGRWIFEPKVQLNGSSKYYGAGPSISPRATGHSGARLKSPKGTVFLVLPNS